MSKNFEGITPENLKRLDPKEAKLENKLLQPVYRAKGEYLKITLTLDTSWPDRLLMLPGGVLWWLEFKRPKSGKLEPLQEVRRAWLEGNGFNYALLDSWEKVKIFIRDVLEPLYVREAQNSKKVKISKQSKNINIIVGADFGDTEKDVIPGKVKNIRPSKNINYLPFPSAHDVEITMLSCKYE